METKITAKTRTQTYDQLYDGVPFIVEHGDMYHEMCCDCGSIHSVKLEVVSDEEVAVTFFKNRTRTKLARKEKSIKARIKRLARKVLSK